MPAKKAGTRPGIISHAYNVIRAILEDPRTFAVDGEKAYRNRYDLVHRRKAERPNQIWQADDRQLDLWAIRDDGQPCRPWLSIIIDDHSRAIAGFFFSFDSPSALLTSLALRQAIWRKADVQWIVFGIPEVLYTDNGSDFTSIHLEQVAAGIKLRLIFSTHGHPRGRGRIERFFETVNQMFLRDRCSQSLPRSAGYPTPVREAAASPLGSWCRQWMGLPCRLTPTSERGAKPQTVTPLVRIARLWTSPPLL